METPDKWVIIKINDYYKVFATWLGGYLDGSMWRINSGISKIEEDETFYYFHGYSGSIYKCYKKAYGTNYYTESVLDNIIDKVKKSDVEVEVLPKDTDFSNLIKENETRTN